MSPRGLDVLGGGEHVVRHVPAALKATHGTREVLMVLADLVPAPEMMSGVRASSMQDGVHLVDDGVVVTALHALLGTATMLSRR